MTPEEASGLRIARMLIANGISVGDAITNPAIGNAIREFVRKAIEQENATFTLRPVQMLARDRNRGRWLEELDRSGWYYWPTLRDYLIGVKGWHGDSVRLIDDETDQVLGQLAPPETEEFDIRGLVLGYVQSGKTANFTALISKAADVGYKLIVVLSGIDDALRRQTQIRLNRELVGYAENRPGAVSLPPSERQWHQFTSEEFKGDFDAGRANYAALNGAQPVLLVMKKNGPRLRRLHTWLDAAPPSVRDSLPLLVVDDEADQASVDTRGDRLSAPPAPEDDYEAPSVINGLIRGLLNKFQRKAYVAYTATPFANVLIPHDNVHPEVGSDLYPKDFVVALPKRDGYFGAEEFFGRLDLATDTEKPGLDVIRTVSDADLLALEQGTFPDGLETALLDFVLSGAARRQRGQGRSPATMLVHTSQLRDDHSRLTRGITARLAQQHDEWRYQRLHVEPKFRDRWETEFRPVTSAADPAKDIPFEVLADHINPFFEAIRRNVREINSRTGEVLDYEREPELKCIAIGGNRLSRGLTLEGLLVSYFVRPTAMYDTLMQMGRWFGYRGGYADLTRIHTTADLRDWFHDLATVEHQLREDITVFERQNLRPDELGFRIQRHPAMLVTSKLKQRFSTSFTVSQTYAGQLLQTVKFPFHRPDDLAAQQTANLALVREFLAGLPGVPDWSPPAGPVWRFNDPERVVSFLQRFWVDPVARSIALALVSAYIARQNELGELSNWTVGIMGRGRGDARLGTANWGVSGGTLHQIGRTRLRSDGNSIGVLTEPGDEETGLSAEAVAQAHSKAASGAVRPNQAARLERSATDGLLLLYPISRSSGHDLSADSRTRQRLFDDSIAPGACDLIGLALSFPASSQAQTVFGNGTVDYATGTVTWRAVE